MPDFSLLYTGLVFGRASPPPPPHSLGERLRALRAALEFFGWSRARLAQATGLSVTTLARLERLGRGPAPALIKLLDFYRAQGLSINWVVAADNGRLFPYSFEERWPDERRWELVEELAEVRRLAQEPLVRERLSWRASKSVGQLDHKFIGQAYTGSVLACSRC